MKIRWNGHSSFSVFSEDGKCIVIDPYRQGSFGGAIGYHAIDSVPDVVLVTHDHQDHNYTDQFEGDFEILRDAGQAKGFTFEAFDAFHDPHKGSDRGKVKMFKFDVDGVKVCHVGDLGQVLSDEEIAKLGDVDVLMVPVGGFYTIDFNEATDLVERLRPKIAIPMHYKTERCGFDIAGVEEFLKGKDNAKVLKTDEIELFADKLPGETEILVLKHRL